MDVQFKKLVAKHREMVYNACLRVLGNSADAQDATQAVFLILWRKGGKVKEASRLAGWLYRVAVNTSKDMIKSKVARRMREKAAAVEMQDKKETVIGSDISDHLDEAIASLPEKIRTPLVLHYFEGYTHMEIGNILRCPRGTVSPRINMGLSMLRARFAKTGTAISAAVLVQHLSSMSAEAAPAALSAALDALAAKGTANAVAMKLAAMAMKKGLATKTGVAIKTAVAMKTGVAVKTKAALVIASALIVTGTGVYIAKKNMAKTNTQPMIEIAPTATPNHVTLPPKTKLSVTANDADGNPLTYTVYEDAENGNTLGWVVFDADPAGASISNVYDADRQSRVIQLSGFSLKNCYVLKKDDGSPWQNTTQFNIKWSMKYSEPVRVFVVVMTDSLTGTTYHRYLQYDSKDGDDLGTGEYVYFGLGSSMIDGQWHTITRDLRADFERAQPGVKILAVHAFLVRGSGKVDDIKLQQ